MPKDGSKTPLEIAEEDYQRKLKQKQEWQSYYENKREEMKLQSTERIARYLDDPGRFFYRGIIYAHKDFDKVLTAIDEGKEWAIVSGLNPSGPLHFGHKAMLDVLLWFQQQFKTRIFLPITNDETYVVGKASSLFAARRTAYEYVIPSIIALGFDPKLTHIFVHSDYPQLANLGMFLGKQTTYNNIRSLFGWTGSENIGTTFYMGALQMASIIMPQLPEFGGPKSVLVPVGIDQHPYIALSRDVARKIGLIPPSEIMWKFLISLKGPDAKMSSSVADSAIFLTDNPEEARRKISKAYTGGSPLASLQRERGGIPEVCSICSLLTFNFLTNEEWEAEIEAFRTGKLLSKELKEMATELVLSFLAEHREKREEAKKHIDEFLLKTPITSILEMDMLPGVANLEEEVSS